MGTLGWIALIIIVLAIVGGNRMSRNARKRMLAEAQTPKEIVGHAKHGTTETLTDGEGGIRLAFDKVTGKILRFLKKKAMA